MIEERTLATASSSTFLPRRRRHLVLAAALSPAFFAEEIMAEEPVYRRYDMEAPEYGEFLPLFFSPARALARVHECDDQRTIGSKKLWDLEC